MQNVACHFVFIYFIAYPDSRLTLGQREYLALAQRWLPTVGRHFAHRPYVGPTGWHNVGPTWVCTTLPLGQCRFVLHFRWANVVVTRVCCIFIVPTWVCTTLPLGQRWANIVLYYTSIGPMWLLHVYVVFSLRQRWVNMGLYYTSTGPMWLYFHWASIGLMHTYSIGVFCWANVYLFCVLKHWTSVT